jgi:glycosyltransferase involved in cell wall biosynthesis
MATSSGNLAISVVIPVHNRWDGVARCLASLECQIDAPAFDVTIIDDGSTEPVPTELLELRKDSLVRLRTQEHRGASTARNRGIHVTSGAILFFVDSDCEVEPGCLNAIFHAVAQHPGASAFQACIVGHNGSLVGKAEALRLHSIQSSLGVTGGRIRWLNTAGFAMRRGAVAENGCLFDPRATRAQDSLLLATLVKANELPCFVPNAIVRHAITLSPCRYVIKSMRMAYASGKTFAAIRRTGVQIHMSNRERFHAFRVAYRLSRHSGVGTMPLLLLILRRAAEYCGRLARMFYELMSREREVGCDTGQPSRGTAELVPRRTERYVAGANTRGRPASKGRRLCRTKAGMCARTGR